MRIKTDFHYLVIAIRKVLNSLMPMPKKSHVFTVQIPTKKYVKKFIEMNYGNPVCFANHPEENKLFQTMLYKPNTNFDYRIKDTFKYYIDILEVPISEDEFYRYGWELSKTDVISFGKFYENRAKFFMRSFVSIYQSLGFPFHQSIKRFQELFDFSEDDWTLEAIRKDFYRHAPKEKIDFSQDIYNKIEHLILCNLSSLGTVCKPVIKQHEKNIKTNK